MGSVGGDLIDEQNYAGEFGLEVHTYDNLPALGRLCVSLGRHAHATTE